MLDRVAVGTEDDALGHFAFHRFCGPATFNHVGYVVFLPLVVFVMKLERTEVSETAPLATERLFAFSEPLLESKAALIGAVLFAASATEAAIDFAIEDSANLK